MYEQIAGEMEIAVGVARATALASTHLDLFASASSTGFMRSAEAPWLGGFIVGVVFLAFSRRLSRLLLLWIHLKGTLQRLGGSNGLRLW